MKKTIFLTATSLFLSSAAIGQIEPNANVSAGTDISFCDVAVDVARVTTTNNRMTLKAVVKSYEIGNNDAHHVKVIVQLPGEAQVISFQAVDNLGHALSWTHHKGYIEVTLDLLSRCTAAATTVKEIRLKAITSLPKLEARSNRPGFGVLAYSQTPDNQLRNNHWFQSVPNRPSSCPPASLNF